MEDRGVISPRQFQSQASKLLLVSGPGNTLMHLMASFPTSKVSLLFAARQAPFRPLY